MNGCVGFCTNYVVMNLTLCNSSRATTTEAAQKRADVSSSGEWSIEAIGQDIIVFKSMPTWLWSAHVHSTCGTPGDAFTFFINVFSFRTCSSFPSFLIFCFENLFKLNKCSEWWIQDSNKCMLALYQNGQLNSCILKICLYHMLRSYIPIYFGHFTFLLLCDIEVAFQPIYPEQGWFGLCCVSNELSGNI